MSEKLILLTAHSGCENTAQNSAEYIQKALDLPCDIIEIDVRKNADGFYLSHDALHGKSAVMLDEALELLGKKPSVCVNFDLKEDIVCSLVEYLEQKNFMYRAFFSGSVS